MAGIAQKSYPLLNEKYLNVVKVFSISIGIGVAKGISVSLTASMQCSVCAFCVFKNYAMEYIAVVSFIRMFRDFET